MIGKYLKALSLGFMLAANAATVQAADVAQGKALARSLCSNCHIVAPGEAQAEVTAGIPSFSAMARKEGQSADRLQAAMLNPHPPMPQVQLSTYERADLAAYILSLKGAE